MAENALTLITAGFKSKGFQSQLLTYLPPGESPDKCVRAALTAIRANPELLTVNHDSIYSAVIDAAQANMPLDAALQLAYLIPYKGRARFQLSARGQLVLVRRSGELISVDHGVIYDNDVVEWVLGDESRLTIQRDWRAEPGKVLGAFAVAKLKGGGVQREVMTSAQIEAIRQRCATANSPAWKFSWDEMARKTVFRRLCKWLPLSIEIRTVLALDEAPDRGVYARLARSTDKTDLELVEEPVEADEEQKPPKQRRVRRPVQQVMDRIVEQNEIPIADPQPPTERKGRDDIEVDPETGEVSYR
jgi:recombination protein RecT